jgi:hypothetical protein
MVRRVVLAILARERCITFDLTSSEKTSPIGRAERQMLKKRTHGTHVVECLITVVAIGLPSRYLWPLRANFAPDWYNHKWAIGYFGEYFRQHGVFPDVLHTTQWGGNPAPVFYGNLAYPLLGLLSSLLTPGIVIRLAAVLLLAAQYYCVAKALRQLEAPRWLANLVACLVIWATYPLTNLFNRNALLEFFATSLLVCALCHAILLIHAPSGTEERRYASRMMLYLVISAGTHPITAMFGIPFFCLVGAVLLTSLRKNAARMRSVLRALMPGLIAAILCLAAWVYATGQFANELNIRSAQPSVLFLPDSWDSWESRFYPIPLDRRVQAGTVLSEIWVPYLDAQINTALLILFFAVSFTAILSFWRRGEDLTRVLAAVAVSGGLFAAGFLCYPCLSGCVLRSCSRR